MGLGDALNEGMKYCTNELVARMDSDDIALPERFEKQLGVFMGDSIDVCSSWVGEFDDDEYRVLSYRKLPEEHEQIVKFFKTRNGINHPAVMYRKSTVELVGGYRKMIGFEDYYLWVRLIQAGAKLHNIQEPLVNMRAGRGQIERRAGLKYMIQEFRFLMKLREIRFLSFTQLCGNVMLRGVVRVLPKILVRKVYSVIRS